MTADQLLRLKISINTNEINEYTSGPKAYWKWLQANKGKSNAKHA